MPNPRTLLYVDSNPERLLARHFVFSIAGYSVVPAVSGAAAWRIFRRRHVDLVITDHCLPGISGAEIAALMKELKPDVPVILLIDTRKAPAGAERADAVLIKTTNIPELLDEAGKLLPERGNQTSPPIRPPSAAMT